MEIVKTIRWLAIAILVTLPLYLIVNVYMEPMLPELLQDYLAIEASSEELSISDLLVLIIGLPTIIAFIVALVGLIGVKLWARKLYLVTALLMIFACLLADPYIDSGLGYTLDQLSVFLSGMIMSLLLYTRSYQEAALNKSSKRDAEKHGAPS